MARHAEKCNNKDKRKWVGTEEGGIELLYQNSEITVIYRNCMIIHLQISP